MIKMRPRESVTIVLPPCVFALRVLDPSKPSSQFPPEDGGTPRRKRWSKLALLRQTWALAARNRRKAEIPGQTTNQASGMKPHRAAAGCLKAGKNPTTKKQKAVREHGLLWFESDASASHLPAGKLTVANNLILATFQSRHWYGVQAILVGLQW